MTNSRKTLKKEATQERRRHGRAAEIETMFSLSMQTKARADRAALRRSLDSVNANGLASAWKATATVNLGPSRRRTYFTRRRRWLHAKVDELPDRDHENDHRHGRDPQNELAIRASGQAVTDDAPCLTLPSTGQLSLITRHSAYSANVSIRSARPKSSSVIPPLLCVDRTNRTLLYRISISG